MGSTGVDIFFLAEKKEKTKFRILFGVTELRGLFRQIW